MKKLEDVRNNFEENLKKVSQLIDIGTDIGNLTVSFLRDLEKQNESMSAFIPYKQKLAIVIGVIENIKDAPQLKAKYEIIRNQSIVLVVENFESFLNDIIKTLINNHPETIDWPEKKKTLPINVDILRYSSPTVGELVVTSLKGDVNFQDLQSTLRFFKDYLKIELTLEYKDNIIFAQALRNIIVHNGSIVDHGFLSQVRNTSYKNRFEDREKIMLSESEYKELVDNFLKFSQEILDKLGKRMGGA